MKVSKCVLFSHFYTCNGHGLKIQKSPLKYGPSSQTQAGHNKYCLNWFLFVFRVFQWIQVKSGVATSSSNFITTSLSVAFLSGLLLYRKGGSGREKASWCSTPLPQKMSSPEDHLSQDGIRPASEQSIHPYSLNVPLNLMSEMQ